MTDAMMTFDMRGYRQSKKYILKKILDLIVTGLGLCPTQTNKSFTISLNSTVTVEKCFFYRLPNNESLVFTQNAFSVEGNHQPTLNIRQLSFSLS